MRRVITTAAALTASVLLLGGCTVSGGDETAPSSGPTSSAPAPESASPTGDEEPEGPSPEELSAQVLDAASAPQGEPVGSQTVTIDDTLGSAAAAEVTFDVLALERTRDATLLRIQLSSSEPGVQLGREALNDLGSANLEFFDRFALEDQTNGVRYRPLSWRRAATNDLEPADGPPNSCICPYRGNNLTLSPEPIVLESLYGPVPEEVTSMTFTAPSGVSIADLPVEPSGP